MAVKSVIRSRLEAQGFCNLDDTALEEIGPWLRWSPSICLFFIALGVLLKSPLVLWALAAIAFLGVLLPFHPFDLLYNHGMRYFTGTRPLPHQGPQRRFACGVATVWLIATGCGLLCGRTNTGLHARRSAHSCSSASEYHEFLHCLFHLQHAVPERKNLAMRRCKLCAETPQRR